MPAITERLTASSEYYPALDTIRFQSADERFNVPQQTADSEIPVVDVKTYNVTREVLAKKGLIYVARINPYTIAQLVTDHATSEHFGYVNPSEGMRSIAPQQVEVALDPKNVRINNSNNESTDTQKDIIAYEEAKLKAKLPESIRGLISMRMPNASSLAQADLDYRSKTGEPLLPNFYVRTEDETVPGDVALVGRLDPSRPLIVFDWDRSYGANHIFAARMVVLPRITQLAA